MHARQPAAYLKTADLAAIISESSRYTNVGNFLEGGYKLRLCLVHVNCWWVSSKVIIPFIIILHKYNVCINSKVFYGFAQG